MTLRALVAMVWLLAAACSRTAPPDAAALHAAAASASLRGELREAEQLATQGLALAAGRAPLATDLQLLRARILLMQRDVAGASALIDAAVPAGPDFERLEALRVYLAGYRLMVGGRLDEALTTLDDAVARAGSARAVDVLLDAHNLAGQALFRRGQFAEAEARLTRAREQARAAGDRVREAEILGTLGMGHLVRERCDAALTYLDQVLDFTELDTHLSYAVALSNAGLCHARLGEFERALELQQRALRLHEARTVPIYLEQALGELGHTQLLRGDAEAAVTLLDRARAVAAEAGRSADAALWTDSSATALIDLGRWDDAERLNAASMQLKRADAKASLAPNLINQAQIAAGRGRHADAAAAFTAALDQDAAPPWVRWQAYAGLGGVLMKTGRTGEALQSFERALAVVENTRSTLLRPEYRIAFLSRMIHFYRAYVDALVTAGHPQRALEVADASRARVLAERFGATPIARVPASVFTTRARRAEATIVAYWLAPERSFAWTVNARGIRIVELPPSPDIDTLVRAHRTFIERTLGDPRRAPQAPGDALSAAVLGPVLSLIPRGGRVIVVPDGSLHAVNFETLPAGGDRRYWIEDATITVAPAVSLAGDARSPAPAPDRSLLIVGNPVDAGHGLGPLQYAAAEIDGIRDAFQRTNVVVHQGRDASPQRFIESGPGAFSTIHFAAHATTSALSPLDSSIELSPGPGGTFKLYARDIAQLGLRADLVTISACRSAGDRAYGGEGLVGLAWAFMRAGATRVIAGLWDVDDQSTAALMTDTYAGLAAGLTAADALRAAKLRMIAAGGNFAKPYYWAPFQVFVAR
jgi:CHAT domain-containing protein/tetratricopeptide (TPR) repeat protein